ncbi:hypothetical protein EXU48_13285 [Occultella glacieicola]|uniref:Uncharacterized protein n=1 Tax=Occultella glacieicola TaxID=2518684 RepID=A0ABY2E2Z5_9MICO|nr:DUF6510 family protein [Occultella glacieicola]TDE92521.1 hypothetical protein EXU48_13285 [Occultella glacieicola]
MPNAAPPHLDGNALAGPFAELLGIDVTEASGRCAGCGAVAEVARAMVYRSGAGSVVRCASCGEVLAVLVQSPDRAWLSMRGLTAIEMRRG